MKGVCEWGLKLALQSEAQLRTPDTIIEGAVRVAGRPSLVEEGIGDEGAGAFKGGDKRGEERAQHADEDEEHHDGAGGQLEGAYQHLSNEREGK
jgi:hypothetical protein